MNYIDWNKDELLVIEILRRRPDIWKSVDFDVATKSKKISLHFWMQHPEILKKYIDNISYYSAMTINDIIENAYEIDFNWTLLSMRDDMTCDIIQEHNNLPWCDTGLSQNPNMTMKFVHYNGQRNWDFNLLMQTILK